MKVHALTVLNMFYVKTKIFKMPIVSTPSLVFSFIDNETYYHTT
jgi:hypothetical protein